MIKKIYPKKLKKGDMVAVIAPSRSLSIISSELRLVADEKMEQLGLNLTFGKHVEETDEFASSSIESRTEDLHEAFKNPKVKAIITVIGGFNSNQILKYLDWELIKNNPKIFCGYSDITALNNAIFAKTGLVSYSGPHYSTFGQKLYFDYSLDYFKKCLFTDKPFDVVASDSWSDDNWWADQEKRHLIINDGFLVINEGRAEGTIIGANLCTFNLLQGTEYFPDLTESILFFEDDSTSLPHAFDRDLQSLIHLPEFKDVKGIVIGRFQNESKMTNELLTKIIKTKKGLAKIPVIANVDFGHTDPKITFPIGGTVSISAEEERSKISITEH